MSESNLNNVRNAINRFVLQHGRYPIPARLSSVQGDLNYGSEGTASPDLCTAANWFASSGMCLTPPPNEVLIGSVPFDNLGLDPDTSHDYWNNRILYAVTLSQTSAGTYVKEDGIAPFVGQIEVQALDNAVAMPPGVLTTVMQGPDIEYRDMVLVSHGENGSGAYSVDGRQALPCNAPGVEYEDENCDMDNVFVVYKHPAGTTLERPSLRSYVAGGTYYDDYTREQLFPQGGSWEPSALTPSGAVWTGGTFIGIGTSDPQVKIHVNGDVTATGKLRADNICANGSGNCFTPEVITGTLMAMDCNKKSTNSAMTGIQNQSVDCIEASGGNAYQFTPGQIQQIDCRLSGQLMIGIDGTGAPVCATP